jgi:8-oxo-dGTP diphosphatase
MKKYTVGFIFTPDYSQVLLVRKNRPQWQAGKLNGIGGKIEEGESSLECVVREIEEETALKINSPDWTLVGNMEGDDWGVDYYTAVYDGTLSDAKTTTDEEVEWHEVHKLPKETLDDVLWLVHISADKHKNGKFESFTIAYK